MVSVTCDIDQTAVARLDGLLSRIRREMPRRLASETRRAAIYICQSLRSRTKVAPKRIRKSEYEASISTVPPKYIHSNSAHRRLLRRWTLTRKLGTPEQYTYHHYVYTDRHLGKGGRMVGGNRSAELRELIQQHGGIPRAGLAKQSWGWAMKQIHGGASADFTWKRRRGDRRDPRQYVKGVFRKAMDGAFALIHNGLDYVGAALQPGAVTEAINAATKRMAYNVEADILRAMNAPSPAKSYTRSVNEILNAYAKGDRATPPKGFQGWTWT